MRIKVAIVIVLVFGAILAAILVTDNRTLSSAQMEQITTACKGCHGKVPAYDFALQVHTKHAAFNCSQCHSDVSGLKSADTFHVNLRWLGVGIIAVVLVGIITNFLAINRKGRAN